MTNDDTAIAPTPDAGSDLVAQGRPIAEPPSFAAEDLARIRAVIPASLLYETDIVSAVASTFREYVKVAAEATALRAEIAALNSVAASPPPGEDLTGQGEPVAWAYEWRQKRFTADDIWHSCVSAIPITGTEGIRNIRPLYAAPAPSRPADWGLGFEAVPDFASAVATAVMGLGWAIPDYTGDEEADAEEQCRRHGMIQDAVAATLRDAPRSGGDGTQEDQR